MQKIEFIATTLLGVEAYTARELKDLGFENVTIEDGRVSFTGDESSIPIANIWLRTAERVLIKLGEFTAVTYDELFERTKALPWDQWIPQNGEFPVKAYSLKSKLFSVPDCQAIVKKAVVEKLKQKYKVDWFNEKGPLYRIQLAFLKDRATLMIDTSGEGLHKRGYRENANQAPLKETLAAALVMICNWKKDRPLMDPFCGSGTIPIEAAMIGANIAPGLAREFVSQTWLQVSKELWWAARKQAHDKIIKEPNLHIYGSDIDGSSIKLAKENAEIAGVEKYIKFEKKPMNEIEPEGDYGYIICNPPYGERMGEMAQVEKLYKEMGKKFSSLTNWSYYIISSHEEFEKFFGKGANKKRKLYNGMIKCNYYQYFGPRPQREK
jgi:putative N6-adenine-specific DNA methylase